MTYHISNPGANPKKLRAKDRRKLKKLNEQIHGRPIKKSAKTAYGKVSNAMQFMREFNQSIDRCPATIEGARKVFPTGIITLPNGDTELTWSNPRPCPTKSVGTGLGRPSAARKAVLEGQVIKISGNRVTVKAEPFFQKPTEGKKEDEKHRVDFASN